MISAIAKSAPSRNLTSQVFSCAQNAESLSNFRLSDPPFADAGLKADVLVPLIYMPLLPLMIIYFRSRVSKDTLNKVSTGSPGFGHPCCAVRSDYFAPSWMMLSLFLRSSPPLI